ncbi:MAG: hypothetical protein WCS28_12260 [Thiomicrospira sp.]
MSAQLEPSHFDIEYLHQHCKTACLPAPTEDDELRFIEQCGKNSSDGLTDLVARIQAFEVYSKGILNEATH